MCNRRRPHGVVAKVLNCNKTVSEFEFQLRYYVHLLTNDITKGMYSLIHLQIVLILFFYKKGLAIK